MFEKGAQYYHPKIGVIQIELVTESEFLGDIYYHAGGQIIYGLNGISGHILLNTTHTNTIVDSRGNYILNHELIKL
jgi:hypothetical protein